MNSLIRVLCVFLFIASLASRADIAEQKETALLQLIARDSLRHNIHRLPSGEYVTAGAHQFNALWTRDFAYRVRPLLLLGKSALVRGQIELTLRYRRSQDGVLPKGFDNRDRDNRSTYFSLRRLLPFLPDYLPLEDPLKPIYEDLNKSMAFDSNILLVMAALDYLDFSGDVAWWNGVEAQLVAVFRYYDKFFSASLLVQPAFSDWQDTVSRTGKVFLTNLLYYQVSQRLQRAHPNFEVSEEKVANLRQQMLAVFRPDLQQPFRAFDSGPYVNTDGNLLALDFGFYSAGSEEAQQLYGVLKQHALWHQAGGIPGRVSEPAYPDAWKPDYVRNVGLGEYHDVLYWSWLMSLSAKVAYMMGDKAEGQRIFTAITAVAKRDHWIYEVYANRPGVPLFAGVLVDSEGPFTWGANFTLDLIDFVCSKGLRDCGLWLHR
jgi:hypothetical protein